MPSSWLLILALSTYLSSLLVAAFSPGNATLQFFKTEPDHQPLLWDIKILTDDRSLLSPGYYFFSAGVQGKGYGPKIYDVDGHLVWDPAVSHTATGASVFRVCDFKGITDKHICWHEGHQKGNLVVDSSYKFVGSSYNNVGIEEGVEAGTHEYNMLPGGWSVLFVWNQYTAEDLRPYLGPKNGWVRGSGFQEEDVTTAEPIFTWKSPDYLDLWESYIFPNVPGHKNLTSAIAGSGTSDSGWDFIHMNAVDKNAEGDYLVSARHLNCIIKVAGPNNVHGLKPGTIISRLGGKKSSYKLIDFIFSRQHHVRYLSTGPTGDILSIYNNAWDGWEQNPPTSPASSGMIIETNNQTWEAKLLHEYPHPEGKLCGSRGGFQVLPDKNTVAGWGHGLPQISEFAEDGTCLFHVHYHYADCLPPHGCGSRGDIAFSYRSSKYPWVAKPHWPPKLISYSMTCDPNNVIAYASWNGATEIKSWNFYISDSDTGPWTAAGNVVKIGFETSVKLPALPSGNIPYVRADALDSSGQPLGSVTGGTFVPDKHIIDGCNHAGCGHIFHFQNSTHNRVHTCSNYKAPSAPPAGPPASFADPTASGTRIPLLIILPLGFAALWLLVLAVEMARSFWRRRRDRRHRGAYAGVRNGEMEAGADHFRKDGAFHDAEEADADILEKARRASLDDRDESDSLVGSSSTARD